MENCKTPQECREVKADRRGAFAKRKSVSTRNGRTTGADAPIAGSGGSWENVEPLGTGGRSHRRGTGFPIEDMAVSGVQIIKFT